jgi:hypothetical protein
LFLPINKKCVKSISVKVLVRERKIHNSNKERARSTLGANQGRRVNKSSSKLNFYEIF